jgi:dihydroneopterin aldolase
LTLPLRTSYVPAVRATLAVTLRNMRFHVRVGVLPHEHELPQSLEVDATVWPREAEPGTPNHPVVDYRLVYDQVAQVIGREPLRYLEDVVGDIARGLLALNGVARVRVVARKPSVSLPGPLDFAEVVLELERDA